MVLISSKKNIKKVNILNLLLINILLPTYLQEVLLMKDLLKSGFDKNKKCHISLLGISYYLSKDDFWAVINKISNIMCKQSSLVIDYPNEKYDSKNKILELGAGEEMQSKYSYKDILDIASKNNLLVYEHLSYTDINKDFFYDYNTLNPNYKIVASDETQYVHLIKK